MFVVCWLGTSGHQGRGREEDLLRHQADASDHGGRSEVVLRQGRDPPRNASGKSNSK